MKIYPVLSVFLLLSLTVEPAHAIDLGANAGLTGNSPSGNVSAGHGSIASVGGGVSSPSIDNPFGPGSDFAAEDGDGNPLIIDPATGKPISFMGRDVLSSDRVYLGKVAALRASNGICPLIGLATNDKLPIQAETVWLRMPSCTDASGPLNLKVSSGRFIEMASR